MPKITNASVKVMRSYDYCHFEINLASDISDLNNQGQIVAVDDLRKQAARLADKAVQQYKVAKTVAEKLESVKSDWNLKMAKSTPEDQRTPSEKAIIKYHSDAAFAAQFDYDYEDDYDEGVWGDGE